MLSYITIKQAEKIVADTKALATAAVSPVSASTASQSTATPTLTAASSPTVTASPSTYVAMTNIFFPPSFELATTPRFGREELWVAILKRETQTVICILKQAESSKVLLLTHITPSFKFGNGNYVGENAVTLVARLGDHAMMQAINSIVPLQAINYANAQGDTPLHIAVSQQDFIMTDMLLRQGQDWKVKNKADKTVFKLACDFYFERQEDAATSESALKVKELIMQRVLAKSMQVMHCTVSTIITAAERSYNTQHLYKAVVIADLNEAALIKRYKAILAEEKACATKQPDQKRIAEAGTAQKAVETARIAVHDALEDCASYLSSVYVI